MRQRETVGEEAWVQWTAPPTFSQGLKKVPLPPVSVNPTSSASRGSPPSKTTTLARDGSRGADDMRMTVDSGPDSDTMLMAFPPKLIGSRIRYSPAATR